MNRCANPCRRVLTVGVACALLVAVGAGGCNKRNATTPRPGGANTEKAEKARKLAEALAADAVKSSAQAQAKLPAFAKSGNNNTFLGKAAVGAVVAKTTATPPAIPKPAPRPAPSPLAKAPPRPTSPVVISDKVSSAIPHLSAADAEEDAMNQARDLVEQRLRELDPPISYRPSLAVVRNEYVRRETRTVRKPGPQESELLIQASYSPERVYVEYEIQLTADQVRELRTQDRVGDALRVTGVLAAVALAGFLFLRFDEWTKGYLTSRLAVAAVLLGGAVAATAVLV